MQTNEMKCAFSQEKKLTEQFIGSCTGTPGKAGADVCGGSSAGVCVGGGHKCLVQEQEEHVCFPLNATTYRNIRLDKLFTSSEVKREAVLCNLGSLHHEMRRYLTLVPKQFVLHTQAPAARSHYVLSQSQAKPAAKPDNQT